MFDNFPLWPARASTAAGNVDALFIFLLIVSGMMTLLIFAAIIYLRRPLPPPPRRSGRTDRGLHSSRTHLVDHSARRFHGDLRLGSCRLLQRAVHLPATPPKSMSSPSNGCGSCNTPRDSARSTHSTSPSAAMFKLIMTSQDVIHSFFVPAFRMKQDVLPGRYTTAWFHATKAGHLSSFLR